MEENNDNTNGYKVEKLNIFYPADIITYMNKNIGNDSLLEVSYYLTGPEGKKDVFAKCDSRTNGQYKKGKNTS